MTMDYENDHWIWESEEKELFSSLPLEKCHPTDIKDVGIPDLIDPSGTLLDQLDSMCPTDTEFFPEWMSEKINLNFLEEIEELSNKALAETSPLAPMKDALEKEEASDLTDLDVLNQLVSGSLPNFQTQVQMQTDTELADEELWEALSAASGLPSPASLDSQSGLSSPASSDHMSFLSDSSETSDVFAEASPSSEVITILPQPVVIITPVANSTVDNSKQFVQKPADTKQSKVRSVLKTAQGTVKPSRKERKKDQNKQAATRYREKKRSQTVAAKDELCILEKRNVELKDTVESMTKEIKYLKDLLQEVLAVKGKLKEIEQKKS